MNDIIWKAFKLSDLFEFSSGNTFALKNYNLYDEPDEGLIEVVTSSKDSVNNQFISADDIPESCPVYEKSLTINRNGSIGYCLYHDDKFIIPTGDSYALIHKNEKFEKVMDIYVNSFLAMIITHLFTTTVFGWSYKVNADRFDRELILLPCLEVGKDDEHIWEENGHYYTLAVEYIKKLMEDAKELREQKTIRLYEAERAKYEAERAKYEAERAKYEAGYKRERSVLVWKGFRLGDIFDRSTKLALSANQKDLNLSEIKDDEHAIALISASRNGSGRVGYLENSMVDKQLVSTNKITFDDQWGFTFFQQEEFVITGGHNAILEVKNTLLKKILDSNLQCYSFLSLVINHITIKSGIFGYGYKINNRFDRELILLPCLEVGKDDEHIWEENGHYYTLAVEYISYIYLTGKMENSQKKIDNYSYQY